MGIFDAILTNIIIPELAAWLKSRHDSGLPPPTEDEIRARLNERADAVIAKGEAFLSSKGVDGE